MFKQLHFKTMLLLGLMLAGVSSAIAADKTFTFTPSSKSDGTLENAPTGVTATFANTYSNANQITSGNSMTLTVSGLATNVTIKGITIHAKTNSKAGAGSVSATMNGTEFGTYTYTVIGSTYTDKALDVTPTKASGNLVVTISCTTNSVYCDKFTFTYEEAAIVSDKPTTPTFSIAGGAVVSGTEIEITAGVGDAIYYSIDGSAPSLTYSDPIAVTENMTIKAQSEKNGEKSEIVSASYTVIIPKVFAKVNHAYTLEAGDQVIIVCEDKNDAMSTTQNTNNRGTVDVTISKGKVSITSEEVQILTLEGSRGAWYFNTGDGYLYAASSSSNYLKTEAESDDEAKATIAIEEGNASIIFQGENERNNIKHNSSNAIYSCYGSGQTAVQLYRLVEDVQASVSDAEWATFVPKYNVYFPSGIDAYIVEETTTSSAKLAAVAAVSEGTPVLLNASKGDYALEVVDAEDCDDVSDNLLKVSDGTAKDNIYVLANGANGAGFYVWAGAALSEGRVYLDAPAGARSFISFDAETSTVNSIVESKADNKFYNLNGQRVAAPQKGLYIVNGKKVIIK